VEQALARQLQQVQARLPRGRLQEGPRTAAELDDVEVLVDEDPWWREALEEDAVRLVLGQPRAGPVLSAGGRGKGGRARRRIRMRGQAQRVFDRPLRVDLVLLVHEREEVGLRPDRLGVPEHEVAAGPQGVVEHRDEPPLQGHVHVDEHVAAEDQVQLREGRVARQVLAGEDASVADGLVDPEPPFHPREEAPQASGQDVLRDDGRIEALPRELDRGLAHVGAEDLHAQLGGPVAGDLP
jgi:hypothetical protein